MDYLRNSEQEKMATVTATNAAEQQQREQEESVENNNNNNNNKIKSKMADLLEGTTPLIRSGESSLGSSSHNLVMGFEGLFRSEACVKLFQQFLNEQDQVNYLLFWLAVNGFKKVPENKKADHLAKIIYKSFIKANSEKPVVLSGATSHNIRVTIDNCCAHCVPICRNVFDRAHAEVESLLRVNFYPQFTKWPPANCMFEFVDVSTGTGSPTQQQPHPQNDACCVSSLSVSSSTADSSDVTTTSSTGVSSCVCAATFSSSAEINNNKIVDDSDNQKGPSKPSAPNCNSLA